MTDAQTQALLKLCKEHRHIYLVVEYQRGAIEHVVDAFNDLDVAETCATRLRAEIPAKLHDAIDYGVIERWLR